MISRETCLFYRRYIPDSLDQIRKIRDALDGILGEFKTQEEWDGYRVELHNEWVRSEEEEMRKRPKPTKPSREGYVYLMKNSRNGLIKIGFSKDPKVREATLQSEEPEVSLIFSEVGTMEYEAELHARFSDKRIRGEWFRLSCEEICSITGGF